MGALDYSMEKEAHDLLLCYVCGKFFSPTTLQEHTNSCLEEREQRLKKMMEVLPFFLPRPTNKDDAIINIPLLFFPEVKLPNENATKDEILEYNSIASKSFQQALISCPKCDRSFHFERLEIHIRHCNARKDPKEIQMRINSIKSSPIKDNVRSSATFESNKNVSDSRPKSSPNIQRNREGKSKIDKIMDIKRPVTSEGFSPEPSRIVSRNGSTDNSTNSNTPLSTFDPIEFFPQVMIQSEQNSDVEDHEETLIEPINNEQEFKTSMEVDSVKDKNSKKRKNLKWNPELETAHSPKPLTPTSPINEITVKEEVNKPNFIESPSKIPVINRKSKYHSVPKYHQTAQTIVTSNSIPIPSSPISKKSSQNPIPSYRSPTNLQLLKSRTDDSNSPSSSPHNPKLKLIKRRSSFTGQQPTLSIEITAPHNSYSEEIALSPAPTSVFSAGTQVVNNIKLPKIMKNMETENNSSTQHNGVHSRSASLISLTDLWDPGHSPSKNINSHSPKPSPRPFLSSSPRHIPTSSDKDTNMSTQISPPFHTPLKSIAQVQFQTKFCTSCGNKYLGDGALFRFCGICGKERR